MSVQSEYVSTADLFRRFRRMPDMRQLVEECYLDEDVLCAARRFYASAEFAAVLGYARPRRQPRPPRVLDLGCGSGVSSLAWAWAGCSVMAVEPDRSDVVGLQALLPVLRASHYDVRVCAALGEQLPFRAGSFDVVYVRQVLHHITDLDETAREVRRVLGPGGIFVATREHVVDSEADLPRFFDAHPTHRYTGTENALRLGEYRASLERAGFRRIREIGPWQSPINYYPRPRSELVDRARCALVRRVGEPLAGYLAERPLLLRIYGRHLGRRDHTPGRMYSFVARA
jgi:ubiquinone/menaquinone biosynthesis C-methylase UbiE